ncbi:MAG: hypothetical protein PHU42_03470 [Patescibacteria group bacterium]|nr:hypothetical protein [Patescibacteria group bacterium]
MNKIRESILLLLLLAVSMFFSANCYIKGTGPTTHAATTSLTEIQDQPHGEIADSVKEMATSLDEDRVALREMAKSFSDTSNDFRAEKNNLQEYEVYRAKMIEIGKAMSHSWGETADLIRQQGEIQDKISKASKASQP